MVETQAHERCIAKSKQRKAQCKNRPVLGAKVCRIHGGGNAAVQRRAVVIAELTHWGTTDDKVDPGEQLLRMIAQSARRAEFYASLLEQAYAGNLEPAHLAGSGLAALIEKKYSNSGDPAGDSIRGLVELEGIERDRCAKWCAQAIAAGLEERRVRLAEQEAGLLFAAIRAALEELGMPTAEVLPAIARRLDAA